MRNSSKPLVIKTICLFKKRSGKKMRTELKSLSAKYICPNTKILLTACFPKQIID